MKILLGILVSFYFLSLNAANYRKDVIYSSLGLKCMSDKVQLYLGAKGQLRVQGKNEATVKVFSKDFDANVLAQGVEFEENFFTTYYRTKEWSWSYDDPYGFEYEFKIQLAAFFVDGAKTAATLRRVHRDKRLSVDQNYELVCTTSVQAEVLKAAVLNLREWAKLEDEVKAAIMGEAESDVSHWGLEELAADIGELTPEQELRYKATAESLVTGPWADKKLQVTLSEETKTLAQKLIKEESQVEQQCIDDFFNSDYNSGVDRDDVLGNWSVCSFEFYVVLNADGQLLGFISDRYNDNGVDDSDGHDGAVIFYDYRGQELHVQDWSR